MLTVGLASLLVACAGDAEDEEDVESQSAAATAQQPSSTGCISGTFLQAQAAKTKDFWKAFAQNNYGYVSAEAKQRYAAFDVRVPADKNVKIADGMYVGTTPMGGTADDYKEITQGAWQYCALKNPKAPRDGKHVVGVVYVDLTKYHGFSGENARKNEVDIHYHLKP
jgi:hypothetical protein